MSVIGKRIVIVGADFSDIKIDTEVYLLDSISVTTPPTKINYDIGEVFIPSGMVVTATLIGEESENVTQRDITGYTYSPTSVFESGGDKNITISYTKEGITKTTNVTVHVIEAIVAEVLTILKGSTYSLTNDGPALKDAGGTQTNPLRNGGYIVLRAGDTIEPAPNRPVGSDIRYYTGLVSSHSGTSDTGVALTKPIQHGVPESAFLAAGSVKGASAPTLLCDYNMASEGWKIVAPYECCIGITIMDINNIMSQTDLSNILVIKRANPETLTSMKYLAQMGTINYTYPTT